MDSLAFRLAKEADMPLVVDSWIDSYRTAHAAGLIPMAIWRETMERVLFDHVFPRRGVEIWVAYHPGEEGTKADLYGWIAIERNVVIPSRHGTKEIPSPLVHYVFVKQAYRRLGIARGLFRAAGVSLAEPFFYSCKTGVVSELKDKAPCARWAPLIVRFPKDDPSP